MLRSLKQGGAGADFDATANGFEIDGEKRRLCHFGTLQGALRMHEHQFTAAYPPDEMLRNFEPLKLSRV